MQLLGNAIAMQHEKKREAQTYFAELVKNLLFDKKLIYLNCVI